MLIKALQDAGRGKWFTVVEREGLSDLLNERKIIRQTRKEYGGARIERLPPLLGSVDRDGEGLAHLFLTDELGQPVRTQPGLHGLVLREGFGGRHLHAARHLHSSALRISSSADCPPPFSSTLRTTASASTKL